VHLGEGYDTIRYDRRVELLSVISLI